MKTTEGYKVAMRQAQSDIKSNKGKILELEN